MPIPTIIITGGTGKHLDFFGWHQDYNLDCRNVLKLCWKDRNRVQQMFGKSQSKTELKNQQLETRRNGQRNCYISSPS